MSFRKNPKYHMAGIMDSFSAEKCFEELLEYKETFGNCNISVPYKIKPELGEFVRTHRILYGQKKKGINDLLSDEQMDRLEKVGFCWAVRGAFKVRNLYGRMDIPSDN
mmetsp:Transcript_34462/g.46146  ORF Transcript_34462/g.46146 Transcript_34462/m.46146 type:complete len:108 (+) Transcript_34462:1455-1778(+)